MGKGFFVEFRKLLVAKCLFASGMLAGKERFNEKKVWTFTNTYILRSLMSSVLRKVLSHFALAAMARQPRRRSPHKASGEDIWCKVKDGKRLVKVDAAGTAVPTLNDVNDVVRVVKFIVKPKLDNVPTDELLLYRTEDAKNRSDEPLPSNMPTSQLVQESLGLYGEPVFLDYDAAPATSSQAAHPHPST